MEGDGEGDEEAQRKVAVQRLLDLASKSKDFIFSPSVASMMIIIFPHDS